MSTTRSKILGGAVAVALIGGIGAGVAAFAANVESVKTASVETAAPTPTPTLTGLSYSTASADRQADAVAAEAARVEAERVAAEAAAAEAARVAAEQAEADRFAAEQAQADQQSSAEPSAPVESDPWAGKMRVPWVADPNPENAAGGWWDTSQCPNGSASTGPDGVAYCD